LASTGIPSRQVIHADAIPWLNSHAPLSGCSVVTSLPDRAEMHGMGFETWRDWFVAAAGLVMGSVPANGLSIFYQSDVLHRGLWVDKAMLVEQAASAQSARLLFHTIVCKRPAGSASFGRAGYAHLLAFSRGIKPSHRQPRVDVLPSAGFCPGTKSMGLFACRDACLSILRETDTRTVVDPFCGYGTVLAVANAFGLDSIGVDLSVRMCRKARGLEIGRDQLDLAASELSQEDARPSSESVGK
jgi:hypothetical protein